MEAALLAKVDNKFSDSENKDRKSASVGDKNLDDKGKKMKRRSKSKSRSRSRSKDRGGRRRRSRSRSRSRGYRSPDRRRRFEERDPRLRGRFARASPPLRRSRERSRDRGPRNSLRRSRSSSNDRFSAGARRNRPNWKKGPMSPEPQMAPGNFNLPTQPIYDANVYNAGYQPNAMGYMSNQQQQYPNYDYAVPMMQQPPPFTAYPPPPQGVIQSLPPGDDFQQANWTVPPPSAQPAQPDPVQSSCIKPPDDKQKREAAVAKEIKNQRETLKKQHDEYQRRATALKRELKILKEQRGDLVGGSEPPSPTTSGFLKENDRLQAQIENKISTIDNVIDMLRGIIGNDKSKSPKPASPKKQPTVEAVGVDNASKPLKKSKRKETDSDDSPERLKTKVMESLKRNKAADDSKLKLIVKDDVEDRKDNIERINYNFFDPELHWCKTCMVFPHTAKDYLTHLHSKEHIEKDQPPESPWHDKMDTDELPSISNAPIKRVPIRGLQFFVPSTGWFCKLCSTWMGDLHCASLHLKSRTHSSKYNAFATKNPHFETDWEVLRQKAYDKTQMAHPPPPPNISGPSIELPFIDSIPLQINQKKDVDIKVTKKSKSKKKKEKKKRKKSKKKRHTSSSSSSSSSSESSENEKVPIILSPIAVDNIDKTASIRVTMRNASKMVNAAAAAQALAEEKATGWTVIQVPPPAPLPPTISANGEAAKRKDELLISQWNAPEPIITEKEKKLLEQLKGRLKSREETKVEKPRIEPPPSSKSDERSRRRSSSRGRDRRDRRSPRRSRSPRNRRRSRSRSRSRSRGRRIEKPIVHYPEFRPRIPEETEKDKNRKSFFKKDDKGEKSNSPAPKRTSNSATNLLSKRLPFIGRMPVFKKQTAEEEKKEEVNAQLEYERKQEQERKQDELKFHIQQKQLMVQQQQKHAEAYVMLHANQFTNAYNNLNNMQIPIIPTVDEYDDLMPDPMQYVSLMGAPPPPPVAVPAVAIVQEEEAPVLPPGIDEDEVEEIQPLVEAPISRKGPLPQDFQDALSIIFDKGAEKALEESKVLVAPPKKPQTEEEYPLGFVAPEEAANDQPLISLSDAEMDERSQFAMYGSMTDQPLVFNDIPVVAAPVVTPVTVSVPPPPILSKSMQKLKILTLPENIPTPPIQILDRNGKLMRIPTSNINFPLSDGEDDISPSDKLKASNRMMELDDLAMLGIDADDLAAQCI